MLPKNNIESNPTKHDCVHLDITSLNHISFVFNITKLNEANVDHLRRNKKEKAAELCREEQLE